MQFVDLSTAIAVSALSFAVAVAALWVVAQLGNRDPDAPTPRNFDDTIVFLFDDTALFDATEAAHHLLSQGASEGTDLDRLISALQPGFPSLNLRLTQIQVGEKLVIRSQQPGDDAQLTAELLKTRLRIELRPMDGETVVRVDPFSQAAMEHELRFLRTAADTAPILCWARDTEGQIVWANAGYLAFAHEGLTADDLKPWPPRSLFDETARVGKKTVRLSLKHPENDTLRWFDVRLNAHEFGTFGFATEVGALVAAENSLKEFVQTLTQTFAHLSTGLAIFDRNRQLALFNPALTDLTNLPFEFLSTRPTLVAFLDRLREKQMMPEPKDYKSWRQQLSDLESAAQCGNYEEMWTLPSGQTYRISGRPHPNGAVAFLFTDISSEISLTRRFRAELEVGQAVIDAMDEGIAVFTANGALTVSNQAFSDIWGIDPSSEIGTFGILDASRHWQKVSKPSPVWGDIRDSVAAFAERAEWFGDVTLLNGQKLSCRVTPIAGGATLVGFKYEAPFPTRALPKELQISI